MATKALCVLWLTVVTAAGENANTLTPSEVAEGWVLLFDGETTFGWDTGSAVKSEWNVQNGSIASSSNTSLLCTKVRWGDFELKAQVRGKGTARLMIGKVGAKDGSVLAVDAVSVDLKQDGNWHDYRVTAKDDALTIQTDEQTPTSKPRAGKAGRIAFLGMGAEIELRGVKLRPLGLSPLFNGKDLTGWKAIDRPVPAGQKTLKQSWTVQDGMLHVEVPAIEGIKQGGQGQLETADTFRDFVLQLDIRTNGQHFNSGVFFRGIPGQFWIGYESQIRNQWEGDDRTKPVDFGTGAIYNRVKARKVVSNDHEFFRKTIVADGRNIAVWVNGYQVTDFTDERPENPNARNGYCPKAGTISLQSHDPTTNLDFKRIEISSLPSADGSAGDAK